MDTRAPHELLPEEAIRTLPPALRRLFAPIPERDVARVAAMSEAERAAYLKDRPLDVMRLERAREKRARRSLKDLRREIQKTTPTLEGLDLAAPLHSKEH